MVWPLMCEGLKFRRQCLGKNGWRPWSLLGGWNTKVVETVCVGSWWKGLHFGEFIIVKLLKWKSCDGIDASIRSSESVRFLTSTIVVSLCPPQPLIRKEPQKRHETCMTRFTFFHSRASFETVSTTVAIANKEAVSVWQKVACNSLSFPDTEPDMVRATGVCVLAAATQLKEMGVEWCTSDWQGWT